MADKVITLAEAQESIRKIVADDPGNVASCIYVDGSDGSPCCIVGHYLVDLGVDKETLLGFNEEKFLRLPQDIIPEFDAETRRFLDLLQLNQDSGYSWEDSYDAALNGVDLSF